MDKLKTVLVGGTLAPRLIAQVYYHPLHEHLPDLLIVPLLQFGRPHVERSYAYVLAEIDRAYPSGEPIAVIGHSQGGLIVSMLAARQPERFVKAIAISAPFDGTSIVQTWSPLWPAARCMAHDSRFLVGLQAELQTVLTRPSAPEIYSIFAAQLLWFIPGDLLIWPSRSSYLPNAHNRVIGDIERLSRIPGLPQDLEIVHGFTDHLREIRSPDLQALLRRILEPLSVVPDAA